MSQQRALKQEIPEKIIGKNYYYTENWPTVLRPALPQICIIGGTNIYNLYNSGNIDYRSNRRSKGIK